MLKLTCSENKQVAKRLYHCQAFFSLLLFLSAALLFLIGIVSLPLSTLICFICLALLLFLSALLLFKRGIVSLHLLVLICCKCLALLLPCIPGRLYLSLAPFYVYKPHDKQSNEHHAHHCHQPPRPYIAIKDSYDGEVQPE